MRVKQLAFSMIEVLITIVVIGVAFISLTYLHAQISEESGITFRQMESIDNAWQAMDSFRKIDNIAVYQGYAAGGHPREEGSTEIVSTAFGDFSVVKTIVHANVDPNYIIVQGESTWTDSNGKSHTDKFRTAIPNIDPERTQWGL